MLTELSKALQTADTNLYFSQERPSVYNLNGPTIAYVRDMCVHFQLFDQYVKHWSDSCDNSDRDEIVRFLTKHIMQIDADTSIPVFSNVIFQKYESSAYSMALAAGNFTFPGFAYIKHKADSIKKYAALHPLHNDRLDIYISKIYQQSDWLVFVFRDDTSELGSWKYSVRNADLNDLFLTNLCETLCKSYPVLRFLVTADTVSEQDIVSLYDLRDMLRSVMDRSDAARRILSGSSRSMDDIKQFVKHSETEFYLLEFRDTNGLVSACYGAVFEINEIIHFVPVIIFGEGLTYQFLTRFSWKILHIQNRQLLYMTEHLMLSDFLAKKTDDNTATLCRELNMSAKTVILRERQVMLQRLLSSAYQKNAHFSSYMSDDSSIYNI